MLIESLSVGAVCLGLAYGLDKFMGTGLFKWKETPKDINLVISKEDQNRKLKNELNLGKIVNDQKLKNKKYYGGHKSKVIHKEHKLNKPHPVIVNFVNKLYKENQK